MKWGMVLLIALILIIFSFATILGQNNYDSQQIKKCPLVNINQKSNLQIGHSNYDLPLNKRILNQSFLVLSNIPYLEVVAKNATIFAFCGGEEECYYHINGVNCGIIPKNTTIPVEVPSIYYVPESCINAIRGGENIIGIVLARYEYGGIYELALEMKTRPHTC